VTRLVAFAAVLAVVFAGALGLGRAVDLDAGEASEDADHAHEAEAAAHESEPASPGPVADGGLRLVLAGATVEAGVEAPLSFRIETDDGSALDRYDVVHDEPMHVIVARRDLAVYQHVHPVRAGDGGWTVPLRLDEPGVYRVFADFTTDGRRVTLGADVSVAGPFAPEPLPVPSASAASGGYEVRLATTPGEHGETAAFTVLRGGEPVADLEPYLGARGHLVALREGDLSFLHVHPIEGEAAPGTIGFQVEYPSAGRYRLFLQFKHQGDVQTVAFTRDVTG
jgi:hypothetical protein